MLQINKMHDQIVINFAADMSEDLATLTMLISTPV